MSVRIDPVVVHIRGYDDTVNINKQLHEMTEPYRFSCLALLQDDGAARIQGLNDTVTIRDFSEIKRKLKLLGAKYLIWRHNSREHRKTL
ncbi:MAG: hypothetical protein DRQ62_10780 [Gammaproteobacteria bacterium]|nr:MAG: hypothetical protein DRQ62_10780 [Gammaproteobacteria bacterium]